MDIGTCPIMHFFEKDPVDNTDVCYKYSNYSVNYTKYTGQNEMMYPGDNGDREHHIRFCSFACSNYLYECASCSNSIHMCFVSMDDHLYQSGCTKKTRQAPMCACTEQVRLNI